MSQLQIDRDYTNATPVALLPGMLHAELSNFTKVWIGSPTGNRLILSDDVAQPPPVLTNYLRLSGGNMLGFLTLNQNAAAPMHAVPLQQMTAAIAAAPYLPLSGGNMTGPLMVVDPPASPTAAASKNYVDSQIAAANYLPLTGGTLTGPLAVNAAYLTLTAGAFDWATLALSHASGQAAQIVGSVAGSARWTVAVADNAPETGGNAGSGFSISRYDDAGNFIASPLQISRADGVTTLTELYCQGSANLFGDVGCNNLYPAVSVANQFQLGSSGGVNSLTFQADYGITWEIATGILRYIANGNTALSVGTDGTASFFGPSVQVNYPSLGVGTIFLGNSGVVSIGGDPVGQIYMNSAGGGTFSMANGFAAFGAVNFYLNDAQGTQPGGGLWLAPADVRISHDIVDYPGGLAEVLRLHPKTFSYIPETGCDPTARYVGLIGQDAIQVMPETVSRRVAVAPRLGSVAFDDLLTVNGTPVLYALINAVKELHTRLGAVEAGPAPTPSTLPLRLPLPLRRR
jgi:hypothetical protein